MDETKKLFNNFEGTVKDTVVEVVGNQMDILGNEIDRVDSELNQALSETNQSVEELNDELYHFKINAEERIKTLEECDIDVDITVDSELNPESENPIQNKVVTKALDNVTKDIVDVKSDIIELSAKNGILNTASGETIVLTDSDEKKLNGLRVFGKSEQNMTMGKNFCEIIIANQTVQNGITFTVNDDKSVTLNGTCTADSYVNIGTALLEGGIEYTISGCPVTDGNVIAFYANSAPSSGNVWNRGYESTFILSETAQCRCTMQILKGAALTNVTVYPMIRLASNTDST